LDESLLNCRIDKTECYSKDFYSFEARTSYSDNSDYSSTWIPVIEKKLNIKVNSTEEFNRNYLEIFVA